ncbi:hypothetical protein ASD81_10990 [Nocardioides sp. Root614]|nr:hypothetical protein ASD81_10990 [Nocardioides sp. Root614]KRA93028.1 hypothetical protein ASD84_11255 [Nocardioides sp. Root682]
MRVTALILLALTAAGCSTDDPVVEEPAATPRSSASTDPSTTTGPSATVAPTGFDSASRRLTARERAAMTGVTWHEGCPVPLADLRVVRLTHRDFEGRRRTGRLVVHADAVADVTAIFEKLYDLDYPIRRMVPIEAYDGDDFASIEADNTSAFNCRAITGGTAWSHHSYGRAIDVNPIENPYVYSGGRTDHTGSQSYLDRSRERPGVLLPDSPEVAAFEDAGWFWGGRWTDPVDHQHFSSMPTG